MRNSLLNVYNKMRGFFCGGILSLCFYFVEKIVYYLYEVKNVVIINYFLKFKIFLCLFGLF